MCVGEGEKQEIGKQEGGCVCEGGEGKVGGGGGELHVEHAKKGEAMNTLHVHVYTYRYMQMFDHRGESLNEQHTAGSWHQNDEQYLLVSESS